MEIITITVVDRENNEDVIEGPLDVGLNVMELLVASDYEVEGICGGMALCASCHCYILSDHKLTEASDDEEDMLDQAFFVEENSRLSCQLMLNPSLNGLKIALAPVGD